MKKFICLLMSALLVFSMTACTNNGGGQEDSQSAVQKIIAEAQNMSLEELAKKAI